MVATLSKTQREILSTFAAGMPYRGRNTAAIQGMVTRGLIVRNPDNSVNAPSFLVTDAGREAL